MAVAFLCNFCYIPLDLYFFYFLNDLVFLFSWDQQSVELQFSVFR